MPPGVYDKDGFKPDPSGGVRSDPNATMTDPKDFETWDWKQIKAAVVGYSAVPRAERPEPGELGHASPDSIRHAAQVFNRVRSALEFVSENLRLQIEALAGENGAWKSPASEVFRSINLHLAANLKAKADQINGGEVMGTRSVPSQLWNAGNYLEWAQTTINQIDTYYASWVRRNKGARQMPNQLTRVSQFPDITEQMAEDMKKVVRILANEYEVTTASVVVPSAVDFQPNSGGPDVGEGPGGGGNPPPALPNGPGAGGGNNPPPSLDIGPPPGADPTGGGPGGTGGSGPPPSLNVEPPPGLDLSGGNGGGGTGGSGPPPSLNVEPPPGLDLSGGDGGGTGGGNSGLRPPPSLDIAPPPGADDTGGGRGGPGLPPSLNIPPPPGTNGGTRGGGGTGGGTTLPKPPPLSVTPPAGAGSGTGNDSIGRPPQLDIDAPPGAGTGNDRGGANLPPPAPMMPPPMAGGPQSGTGGDRPDSSGLLGGLTEPWEAGSPPPATEPSGTEPPSVKPEDWAASPSDNSSGGGLGGGLGSQVPPPMMPPPMAGGPQSGAAGDRPDSSGLLGGEREPWEGAGLPAADLDTASPPPSIKPEEWAAATGDIAGTDVQVPAVSGPTATEPPAVDQNPGAQEPSAQQVAAGGAGAGPGSQVPPPMMPPPMAGGQPSDAGGDRPDSSGLLGGLTEPWAGMEDVTGVGGTSGETSASAEKWAVTLAEPVVAHAIAPAESLPVVEDAAPVVTPVEEVVAVPQAPAEAVPEPVNGVPAEEIAPTPAAAPAGWAASSDVVAGGHQGTQAESAPHEPTQTEATQSAALFAAGAATTAVAFGAMAGQVPGVPPTGPTPPGVGPAHGGTSAGVPHANWGTPASAMSPHGATPAGVASAHGNTPAGVAPANGSTPPEATPAYGSTYPGAGHAYGHTPAGVAEFIGSGYSSFSEFPQVDQDGNVQDDRDEDAGGGLVLQPGGAGALPAADSVAVVRVDAPVKDISAWDSGNSGFLLAAAPLAAVAAKSDQSSWDTDEKAPEFTLSSSEPWEPEPSTTHATYRRRKFGEAPVIVDDEEDEPYCGDEYSLPEDEREDFLAQEAARLEWLRREEAGENVEDDDENDDEEPEERSAADLLSKSNSAWGSTVGSPSGVLE